MSAPAYEQFLDTKLLNVPPVGMTVASGVSKALYPFQKDLVKWALKRGRSAIFADCGMGKTAMQLEWARQVFEAQGRVLILAPLAVAAQTVREGKKFGIEVKYCRSQEETTDGINITNYEMLDKFDPEAFAGVVLDESSILKAYDGKTRTAIIQAFRETRFRLACTATPAPNDFMELGNHSEFLGVMTRAEMLAMFFCHDGGSTQDWRIKGHAEEHFWRWVCQWAVMIRKPSDIGHDDAGFILPPLNMSEHVVPVDHSDAHASGMLFKMDALTLQEQRGVRRATLEKRVAKCAEMVNASKEPWLIWCELNDEGDALAAAIPDAVQVSGADSAEHKERAVLDFIDGRTRVMVSKVSIFGFGMNLQACRNIAFVGVSHSYEQFYQAIRRCWRFGQKLPVNCHIITAETEGRVLANLKRKEKDAEVLAEQMVKNMEDIQRESISGTERQSAEYKTGTEVGEGWTAHLGDCVDVLRTLAEGSIDYSIFSPPFASLYTYSNSLRDMGNVRTHDEFYEHFRFLVPELFRVIAPGRLVSFHCMNLPTSKVRDGYIGLTDFRGLLIKAFQDAGWIYHSEVVIWKDPVTAMQRTKALGLLHKQIRKDSCMSRQGIPDYLVTMRKPGENAKPNSHTAEEFPVDLWQRYASPVWMDINPSKTLQKQSAREEKDERHICPLQLEVIERAVELWSASGDLVLSPFMGIGSEGYVSVKMGRRFVGAELKESYFKQAVGNLRAAADSKAGQLKLIDHQPEATAS